MQPLLSCWSIIAPFCEELKVSYFKNEGKEREREKRKRERESGREKGEGEGERRERRGKKRGAKMTKRSLQTDLN